MIAIILGTRPEIIKMSPIIRECEKRNCNYYIIHTGQHYSYDMDKIFFEELELPSVKYNLEVGSGSHAEQTGKIMAGIEKVLMTDRPDLILVQGDTNTVLAGALAASKLLIKIAHVEAGLRSFDRRMPEEINRVVADHISDHLFAPTELAKSNLTKEGIDENKITVTGNTIVDSVQQSLKISEKKIHVLKNLGIEPKNYIVVTLHRQENVDVEERLVHIINGLKSISSKYSMPIIFPMHPRTEKMIEAFGISLGSVIKIKPLGFMEFLQLESNARLVITDSGGVQEETCILGVPCITLRDNTERPETVAVGSNILCEVNNYHMLNAVDSMIRTGKHWENPFGDGKTSERIVDISMKFIKLNTCIKNEVSNNTEV